MPKHTCPKCGELNYFSEIRKGRDSKYYCQRCVETVGQLGE